MKDNRWTIRSTEWQIKGVRSAGSPKCWRDDIVGQQEAVWTRTAKDRESWTTLAEGYFLQLKDTAQNRIEWNIILRLKPQQSIELPVKHGDGKKMFPCRRQFAVCDRGVDVVG